MGSPLTAPPAPQLSLSLAGGTYGTTVAELDLDEGRLVALALGDRLDAHPPPELVASWHSEERALLETFLPRRRRTWVGGRLAIRRALALEDAMHAPILADDRGAPRLPPGVVGSIAHKDEIAVAIGGREAERRIGVDVEVATRPTSLRLTPKILRPGEAAHLLVGTEAEQSRALLLAFSAKEAIYKAIDPFVRRYVGFHEVRLHGDPSAYDVEPILETGERLHVEARAFVAGDVVIAVARASRR